MKKLKFLVIIVLLILTGVACGPQEEKGASSKKIGIVLSTGGLGDQSYNDAAYKGLRRAEKELGISFRFVEPANPSEFYGFLRDFSEADFDLIIGIGFQMADALEAVAKDYPNMNYLMVDEPIDLPNVKSAVFDEAEGSFLAGVLAGLMTENNRIGFVGGMDVPLIKRFGNGYFAGARYVNENIRFYEAYCGGLNPFNDPAKGKEIAISMIEQGADVLYHAAAGSGMGVFEAAHERNVFAIGVDSNQDSIRKGTILSSMLKKIDVGIYTVVKDLVEGRFESGISIFNIENNGVGLSDFEFTKDIIGNENLEIIENIKKDIVEKRIKVQKEIKKI